MKIWLIRHAKSSWSNPGKSDFDRPLNSRGKRDGPHMARWLAEQDDPATWIWSSDAARALATAEFVREGFSAGSDQPVTAHELYLASPELMIDVLKRQRRRCCSQPGHHLSTESLNGQQRHRQCAHLRCCTPAVFRQLARTRPRRLQPGPVHRTKTHQHRISFGPRSSADR